jgi:transposase-like protein
MKIIPVKTTSMKQIETNTGEDIEETLRRLFVDENLSQMDIANQLHVSYVTVVKWLRQAGIRSRKLNVH